jgi:hypothetical protein
MGTALATVTAEGESFSTLQLQMSYFLPVMGGRLGAHARVVRRAGDGAPGMRSGGWGGEGGGAGYVGVRDPAGGISKERLLTMNGGHEIRALARSSNTFGFHLYQHLPQRLCKGRREGHGSGRGFGGGYEPQVATTSRA